MGLITHDLATVQFDNALAHRVDDLFVMCGHHDGGAGTVDSVQHLHNAQRCGRDGKEWPCGWMEDRYGVYWQTVNQKLLDWTNDPDIEKAQRATQEMYKMKKIDLAQIQRAHDGLN